MKVLLHQLGVQNFKLYFGMVISSNAILKCYSTYLLKNCVFFVGDAERIPLKNMSVDMCGAQGLFEHLSNPKKCATEIFRILSNHGGVYIDTNHKDFSFFICDMFISKKLMTLMFRIIVKLKHEWQKQKNSSNETKDGLPIGLIEFDKKDDFIPVRSRKDNFKKIFNFVIGVAYYPLIPDRILEIVGQGESVILMADKRTELLE